MFNTLHPAKRLCLAGFALAISLGPLPASTLWNESINGDLSNNQAAPNAFTLGNGANSVIGNVGPGDSQDWIALTVPAGFTLSSVVLAAYTSADVQGFTGFQIGNSFVGSPFVAGSYAGYSHYGTGAQNGPLPPTNLIGQNLIPIMADNTPGGTSPGAAGFAQPLGAGTYTFLIQQLGGSTAYQFNYNLTPVPEPAMLALVPFVGGLLLIKRLRPGRGCDK
jgi:hypothetical protein